ncbi:hypothetical protein SYNPS1DRAFT_27743 [Syncephalis pseudoplumigaleata]|uniref:RGS domain-containing protein n=1 Tax=Syncephalis pseudoplumigaleata TaxID=1712513 RepID=A0A4V1J1X5_9FUNG|nr:hypothetical protein SYNPS1DRAFT_27743 [Syncephalis pseudoplumigaleata]|eukprot:RKP26579.1 hypothetical protein SYNPS1DRAFT_27743 [Syncephalis pseudoplumigaleata]
MTSPPSSAKDTGAAPPLRSPPPSTPRAMPPLVSVPAEPASSSSAHNTSFQSLVDILSPTLNSAEWPPSPLCPPPRTPPPTLPATATADHDESTMLASANTSSHQHQHQHQHHHHHHPHYLRQAQGWSAGHDHYGNGHEQSPYTAATAAAEMLVHGSSEPMMLERGSLCTLDDYFSQSGEDAYEEGEVAIATTKSFSSLPVLPVNTASKAASLPPSDNHHHHQQHQPPPPPLPSLPPPFANEERLQRMRSLRNARTASHITEFTRILVAVLEDEEMDGLATAGRAGPKTFPVTVHRGHTVEELARMIEAEYAFLYGESMPPPVPMKSPTRANDTSSRSNMTLLPLSAGPVEAGTRRRMSYSQASSPGRRPAYRPLVCGQLFVGMVPLRYDDFVGDVLDMNDVVRVINIYEDDDANSSFTGSTMSMPMSPEADASTMSFAASRGKGDVHSPMGQPPPPPPPLHHQSFNTSADMDAGRGYRPQAGGLEDRFRQCVNNEFSLAAFQAHCAREFTLESLLFFLEVEVFRELAGGDPARLPAGVRIEHYARYIYDIYIDNEAPLQVNLSEEIREEVANSERCWSGLFDGAQDMVHATLKRHSFVRFEASDAHMLLARLRQQDPMRYHNANMQQSLAELFPPSGKLLACVLSDAPKPRASSSSFQRQRFDAADDLVVNMCQAREETLARVLSRFHPGPDVTSAVDGYFADESARMTPAQKQRCIHMERKLTHFFGHHPDPSQVQKQAESSEVATIYSTQQQPQQQQPRLRSSASAASLDSVMSRNSMLTMSSGVTAQHPDGAAAANAGFHTRRRRLRKLEGFFGDRLPGEIVPSSSPGTHPISMTASSQSYPGGLRDTAASVSTASQGQKARRPNKLIKKNAHGRSQTSNSSEELDREHATSHATPHASPQIDSMDTNNELDPEMRRELRRRRHKLNRLFGEPLNEEIVFNQLVKPNLASLGSEKDMVDTGVITATNNNSNSNSNKSTESPSTTEIVLDASYIYNNHGRDNDDDGGAANDRPRPDRTSSVVPVLFDGDSVRSRSMISLSQPMSGDPMPAMDAALRNRSISIDAVSTSEYSLSPSRIDHAGDASTEESAEQQAREQRRKKVEKLFRVLGVHVPAEMINAAQERINSYRDYATHHGASFVQSSHTVVTVAIDEAELNANMPPPMSASEKRAGVRRAEKLERMFGARPPKDLVVPANTAARNSISGDSAMVPLDTTIASTSPDDSTVDSLLEYVSSPETSYEDPNAPEAIHDKIVRQRRLRKLKRFFGHELESTQLTP